MRRRFSIVAIIFGAVNIVVAFVPPVTNTLGVMYVLAEPPLPFRHVDVGPPIWQHIRRDLPSYKPEMFGSAVCNAFLSLLLVVGAVGLFLNHDWGRVVTLGAAALMILAFCVHDVYQLGVVRPSVIRVFRAHLPPGPPGEAEGAQIGFTISWFFWCWANAGLMLYLLAMSVTIGLTRILGAPPAGDDAAAGGERRRRRDRDDD